MSQADTTGGVNIKFGAVEDRKLWGRLCDAVADARDEPPGKLSNREVAREAARAYLEKSVSEPIEALEGDKRLEEVRRTVAKDHGMDPEEVSTEAALLQACAAYAGFQRVDDWEV